MGRDRAAYMRDYRARQRGMLRQHEGPDHLPQPCKVRQVDGTWSACDVETLRSEVERLTHELAARSVERGYSTRPFTPAPKGKP